MEATVTGCASPSPPSSPCMKTGCSCREFSANVFNRTYCLHCIHTAAYHNKITTPASPVVRARSASSGLPIRPTTSPSASNAPAVASSGWLKAVSRTISSSGMALSEKSSSVPMTSPSQACETNKPLQTRDSEDECLDLPPRDNSPPTPTVMDDLHRKSEKEEKQQTTIVPVLPTSFSASPRCRKGSDDRGEPPSPNCQKQQPSHKTSGESASTSKKNLTHKKPKKKGGSARGSSSSSPISSPLRKSRGTDSPIKSDNSHKTEEEEGGVVSVSVKSLQGLLSMNRMLTQQLCRLGEVVEYLEGQLHPQTTPPTTLTHLIPPTSTTSTTTTTTTPTQHFTDSAEHKRRTRSRNNEDSQTHSDIQAADEEKPHEKEAANENHSSSPAKDKWRIKCTKLQKKLADERVVNNVLTRKLVKSEECLRKARDEVQELEAARKGNAKDDSFRFDSESDEDEGIGFQRKMSSDDSNSNSDEDEEDDDDDDDDGDFIVQEDSYDSCDSDGSYVTLQQLAEEEDNLSRVPSLEVPQWNSFMKDASHNEEDFMRLISSVGLKRGPSSMDSHHNNNTTTNNNNSNNNKEREKESEERPPRKKGSTRHGSLVRGMPNRAFSHPNTRSPTLSPAASGETPTLKALGWSAKNNSLRSLLRELIDILIAERREHETALVALRGVASSHPHGHTASPQLASPLKLKIRPHEITPIPPSSLPEDHTQTQQPQQLQPPQSQPKKESINQLEAILGALSQVEKMVTSLSLEVQDLQLKQANNQG